MPEQYFKTNKKPEAYTNNELHTAINRDIWRRPSFLVGGINVKGRSSWAAVEPRWNNEVIYYNTAHSTLSSYLNKIVVHHTNNSYSISENEQKQKTRGYAALGYHFFIGKDGVTYEGRPIEVMGSHAGVGIKMGVLNDPDWGAIGIVLQGDFHHADDWLWSSSATKKQISMLEKLVKALKEKYLIKSLLMHSEVSRNGKATVCPGDHLVPTIKSLRKKLGLPIPKLK